MKLFNIRFMDTDFRLLEPLWDIPGVRAFTVLARSGSEARVTFDEHSTAGRQFRKILEQTICGNNPVFWLHQVHGTHLVQLPVNGDHEADGSCTSRKNVVCAVLTADCLPIVFATRNGTKTGIVHAGRRGLYLEIIARLVSVFGIPPDEISKVFDEFYRASNVKKDFKTGSGLGLSIVKQIIENHKGKIWVQSELGLWTKFVFTLPKNPNAEISHETDIMGSFLRIKKA